MLKCGGAVAADAAEGILAFAETNDVVVVHGAGPQISGADARARARGRRSWTAAATRRPRRSRSSGSRSPRSTRRSSPRSARERSASWATSIGLEARQVSKLGLVGDPLPSRPALVLSALRQGRIPVIAPLAKGPLNVNADEAAVALAAGLGAERILFVTDVPGLLVDGDVVSSIGADEADHMLDDGTFQGGIVPKLQAAVRAARLGMRAEIGETAVSL